MSSNCSTRCSVAVKSQSHGEIGRALLPPGTNKSSPLVRWMCQNKTKNKGSDKITSTQKTLQDGGDALNVVYLSWNKRRGSFPLV